MTIVSTVTHRIIILSTTGAKSSCIEPTHSQFGIGQSELGVGSKTHFAFRAHSPQRSEGETLARPKTHPAPSIAFAATLSKAAKVWRNVAVLVT